MVASRDMVFDVVRGGRQPARDEEPFKGCAASVLPRGGGGRQEVRQGLDVSGFLS